MELLRLGVYITLYKLFALVADISLNEKVLRIELDVNTYQLLVTCA